LSAAHDKEKEKSKDDVDPEVGASVQNVEGAMIESTAHRSLISVAILYRELLVLVDLVFDRVGLRLLLSN
jgi:hypothetical protein